jgi:hypothetical protein
MTLSGPDLPFTITLPLQHEVRFSEEKATRPSVYEEQASGPAYTVNSYQWGFELVEAGLAARDPETGYPDTDDAALFYPESDLLDVEYEGRQYLLQLSPYQSLLLRNYIELGRAGMISSEPSVLDYVSGLHALGRSLEIGTHDGALSPDLRAEFLSAARGLLWQEGRFNELRGSPSVVAQIEEIWFSMGDGEVVTLQYWPQKRLLLDWTGWRGLHPGPNPSFPAATLPDAIVHALEALPEAPTKDETAAAPDVAGSDGNSGVSAELLLPAVLVAGLLLTLIAMRHRRLATQS